jgi:hypothetical protein
MLTTPIAPHPLALNQITQIAARVIFDFIYFPFLNIWSNKWANFFRVSKKTDFKHLQTY